MPLFQSAAPIDQPHLQKILKERWGIKIEKLLKTSQNHTYSAFFEDSPETKCSVRVTPNPNNIHFQRIKDELTFVQFCAEQKLQHVCAPIKTIHGQKELFVKDGDLIIVAFQWAIGEQVNFFDFTWMKDVSLIKAWGRYFAQLHTISKKFSKEHKQVAERIQNWNQIHHGILKSIQLSPQDTKDLSNTDKFGVVHGDLNTSNFYYNRAEDYISVYDTDQTQRAFYELDLSQAIFGVVMLKEAGVPISGDPFPDANQEFFQNHLISGYESVAGQGAIDRQRLKRMIQIRKQFYILFCQQAIKEGGIPKDMQGFIHYIAKGFSKK